MGRRERHEALPGAFAAGSDPGGSSRLLPLDRRPRGGGLPTLALAGDWDAAGDLLAASYDDWRTRQLFLHIVVQHQVVEDAEAMYRRAASFLDGQETEEFRAELADLIHQLLALEEQEQLSWGNVL